MSSTVNVMIPYAKLSRRDSPSNSLDCKILPNHPIHQGPSDLLPDNYIPFKPFFLPSLTFDSEVVSYSLSVPKPTITLTPAVKKFASSPFNIGIGYCNNRLISQEQKNVSLMPRDKKVLEITAGDCSEEEDVKTKESSSPLHSSRLNKSSSYSNSNIIPCGWGTSPMNGSNRVAMTGSSNPVTEDLKWLANVGTVNQNHSLSPSQSSVIHLSDPPGLPASFIHSDFGSLFHSPASLRSDLNDQRFYSSQFQFSNHHTPHSPSLSGTSINNKSSQLTTYNSLYPAYSNCAPSLGRQHFFSSESYPVVLPKGGSHTLSVTNHPLVQPQSTVALSHSISVPSHLTQVRHNYVPTASPCEQQGPLIQTRSHYLVEPSQSLERKHYINKLSSRYSPVSRMEDKHIPSKSTPGEEVQFQLSKHSVSNSCTKQVPLDSKLSRGIPQGMSYKIPAGKEGSLKHRILRPSNIHITEPPASALHSAPLSAPPIHGQRDELPSPKQPCLGTPVPQSSFSSFSSHAAQRLIPPKRNAVSNAFSPSNDMIFQQANRSSTSQLHYPVYFRKGSIIQLADGQLKKVENLATEDFIHSASQSADLRIDSSTVVKIEEVTNSGSVTLGFCVGNSQVQVSVEAPVEHPFYIFQQGWSSCSPERSLHRYGLVCQKLKIGDVCICLTQKFSPDVQLAFNQFSSPGTSAATFTVPNSVSCDLAKASVHVSVGKDFNGPSSSIRSRIPLLSSKKSTCATTTVTFSRQSPLVATTITALHPQRKRRWSAPDIRSEAK
ncbi:ataxin-1-like [Limulus polyphemus]|uniref:Ataxin-1-like n=1 Tax=Limulus polyphemus TaxID=6850 RepID=A0ABM1SNT7_LIMPO|nr:ataxin-1-like [Limulus polyphemus]